MANEKRSERQRSARILLHAPIVRTPLSTVTSNTAVGGDALTINLGGGELQAWNSQVARKLVPDPVRVGVWVPVRMEVSPGVTVEICGASMDKSSVTGG
jgi:hypothetical protein